MRSQGQAFGRFATLDTAFHHGSAGLMNNQEVTMYVPLDAETIALEAAASAIALVRPVPAPLRSLADQVVRSASSVPANLAEGNGRSGKDRTYHWRIAYASAKEVDVHIRLLINTGALKANQANTTRELFDRVRAMTWRLINPKRP